MYNQDYGKKSPDLEMAPVDMAPNILNWLVNLSSWGSGNSSSRIPSLFHE